MRNVSRLLITSLLSLTLLPFAAYSEESDEGALPAQRSEMTREERRAAWEGLSEEEIQAKRDQMRAKREQRRAEWQAMTPEERQAKREQMRKRMESMTPEQREATKQRRHRHGRCGGRKDAGE